MEEDYEKKVEEKVYTWLRDRRNIDYTVPNISQLAGKQNYTVVRKKIRKIRPGQKEPHDS